MAEGGDGRTTSAGAWGQAVAAVVMVAALGAGLWTFQQASMSAGASPAACTGGRPEQASGRLSGAQLCAALNRPDLAGLLGTPGQAVQSAEGGDGSFRPAGGEEIAAPSARVEFATYTVELTATYDDLPVAASASSLGDGGQRTVLGRPAAFSSDRTTRITFRLDGSDAAGRPGVPTRTLTVARDPQDSGGSFDMTLWRADGVVPDDAVLLRVAEAVLPTVPGWVAEG
ncbi:DUF6215 domain-containing protein [Streptomyces sp. NPDC044571]|uniref:DUF6215 domain-containing protein n=1 Tax=Streptomyces sp. NPDC044571 TaxID=3155371 RepID=UPI0033EEB93A